MILTRAVVLVWLLGCLALFHPELLRGQDTNTESKVRELGKRLPNVLVFLSDDQGWGDFGFQGNSNLKTPNIDSLARDGSVLTRFYVSPVCSPTRGEFLTGRYHPRCGILGVTEGAERLDLDEVTIADVFKYHGYATGAFGKWHSGSQYPYHPNGRGFEEFYGFCSGHWGDYFSPPLQKNGEKVRGDGFVADDFTSKAIEFIRSQKDRPFFCYIAFNTPHSPMQVPDAYMDRFRDKQLEMLHESRGGEKEDLAMTRAALAMVENLDDNVGRILTTLEEIDVGDETIVVYFNDNGPNSFRLNGGMKGRKGSLDEGGTRSPLMVRWPGHVKAGGRVQQLAGAIDILPTLISLVGLTPSSSQEGAATKPLDGISLAGLLTGETTDLIDRTLFGQWNGRIAMREGNFLLDAEGKLYDVVADPAQKSDLTNQLADRVESMKQGVRQWRSTILQEADQPARPFPVGFLVRPRTELPAQDGRISGRSVKRSARAPNCSFFTQWSDKLDVVSWEVEVVTGGVYRVVLNYAAPSSSVGTEIECSMGDKKIIGIIDMPHESPLRGAENDRVPRDSESLVKEFRPMTLGRIALDAGRGKIQFRLAKVVGDQGVELQSVELILE